MKNFTKLITSTLLMLTVIAITIVSCKKDDDQTDQKPQVYYDGMGEIGSNGGTIYFNDDTSPINGAYIAVPADAMGSEQSITISQANKDSDFTGSSDIIVVELEPDGLEFTSEVEVAIPYPDNFNADKLTVFYYKNGSNKVDVMPISSVDKTNKLVKFKTTHFSGYFASEDGLPCPGTPTVEDADGNIYNTVNIGGQCWMKENLNVGTQITAPTEWPQPINNNQVEKYCYEDDAANCETYGGLYLWEEYMNFNESNPQGICPDGWRIPTMADFDALVNYSGGYGYTDAHIHLKSTTSDWGYSLGDNESGFTARPGECWDYNYLNNGGDPWLEIGAVFGASDVNAYGSALVVGFNAYNISTRFNGATSIRCIKAEGGNYNQPPTTPALNFPVDGADVSLPFNLQYSSTDPDNDPLSYDIYLSTNSNPDEFVNGINENTYEITELATGQAYYWKVIVNDGQGHQAESEIYSFNVTGSENLPPTTPVNPSPENNATVDLVELTLNWICTDPEQDPILYDIYFGTSSDPNLVGEDITISSYPVNNLQENTTYYWKIIAQDDQENVTDGPIWSFTVQGNVGDAPIANYSADVTSGEAPLTVNFTDDSQNNPTSWQWDFGDGGTSTQPDPSHTYNTDGSYTVSLTVSNDFGSDTKTETNYIIVNSGGTAPITDFTANITSGEAPLTVSFTDQSTNNPTTWQWDFGDGGTSTQPDPSHTYNTDGSYTVSLTVTNEYGNDTKTRTGFIYVGSGGGGPDPDGYFTDSRDGQEYAFKNIGSQTWMYENLNYETGNSWCFNNDPAYCGVYGRLYDWATIMNGESSSNTVPSGVQGICPDGWHLPSDAEWIVLTDYLGGEDVAGGKMKEAGTTHWNSPNTGATNSSGFTALPGGYRFSSGLFGGLGNYGYWWSSSEVSGPNAWYRRLYYSLDQVYRGSYGESRGHSVRCLKN